MDADWAIVSGVILLWLVYVSGINGYMLPWDGTAQFVTVATAEWLDWLPVFNGALIRNFITPDAINDRLFSLLSFLHIGIPLALGSWWGLILLIPLTGVLVWRLVDEEKFLHKNLPGYTEYAQNVRCRLVPHIW